MRVANTYNFKVKISGGISYWWHVDKCKKRLYFYDIGSWVWK